MTGTSDRVVEALARLNNYANSPGTARNDGSAPLTIGISRQAGAGGAEIAQAVGTRLGWPVYDHELLDRIAEERGINTQLLERLDERYLGGWEELVLSFLAPGGQRAGDYLRALLGLLASLGKTGYCIIVGHGAPQVLPPETTLRVRVIAPRQMRIAAVQKNRKLSASEAERWIEATDRERLQFVDHYFRANDADPVGYDLVLNRERADVEECSALIVQAARVMQTHAR